MLRSAYIIYKNKCLHSNCVEYNPSSKYVTFLCEKTQYHHFTGIPICFIFISVYKFTILDLHLRPGRGLNSRLIMELILQTVSGPRSNHSATMHSNKFALYFVHVCEYIICMLYLQGMLTFKISAINDVKWYANKICPFYSISAYAYRLLYQSKSLFSTLFIWSIITLMWQDSCYWI